MKIFFDTEFMEDGKTIDLLSIGMVREDGWTYYAVAAEADRSKANPFVTLNVLPYLGGPVHPRVIMARHIQAFAGEQPEFWAYYASYDWVVLCQLFGTMMDLPKGWPMFCRDLQQTVAHAQMPLMLPEQKGVKHNALDDALWVRDAHNYLTTVGVL